ncbi:hypothetical protein V8C86DRAFT_118210 [Haematococcus lacustris]
MAYNLLADVYARNHAKKLYPDAPAYCLSWRHRFPLLVKELLHWGPDIVCLQEVQHFEDLQEELSQAGYQGAYLPRGGWRRDGCATFWRREKLQCLEEVPLRFAEYDLEDNVALLLRLALRSSGGDPAAAPGRSPSPSPRPLTAPPTQQPPLLPSRPDLDHTSTPAQPPQLPQLDQPPLQLPQLVVANTHVCFDPDKGHVKLGQARTLFTAAHELGQPHSCLVVIAGDFNTCPASPLYQFMEQGSLDLMTTQRTALSGQSKNWGTPADFRALRSNLAVGLQIAAGQEPGHPLPHPTPAPSSSAPNLHTSAPALPAPPPDLSHPSHPSIKCSHTSMDLPMPTAAAAAASSPFHLSTAAPHSSPVASTTSAPATRTPAPPTPADAASTLTPRNSRSSRNSSSSSSLLSRGLSALLQSAQHQLQSWACGEAGKGEAGWGAAALRSALGPAAAEEAVRSCVAWQQAGQQGGRRQGRGGAGGAGGGLLARHPLEVLSSYKAATGAEPAFSSTHGGYHGCCDYLWFTPHSLQPCPDPNPGTQPGHPPHPDKHKDRNSSSSSNSMTVSLDGLGWGLGQDGGGRSSKQGRGSNHHEQPEVGQGVGGGSVGVRWRMQPEAVLAPPCISCLPMGLPAPQWGSDHIPIMARYVLEPMNAHPFPSPCPPASTHDSW